MNSPSINPMPSHSLQRLAWGIVLVLLLSFPTPSIALEIAPAEESLRSRIEELKLGLIEIKGQLLRLLEQSQTRSAQTEIYLEVRNKTQGLVDPHSMPNFMSLQLNQQTVLEHHYSDTERVALQRGGIQRLYVGDLYIAT